MNEQSTYEFVVDEKAEGSAKAKKTLGRGGILLIITAYVVATCAIHPALAVLPVALLPIVLYFWKQFNVELEYSMTSGLMTFTRIYGGRRRKQVLELSIKDMKEIAPVTADTQAHLEALGVQKIYRFQSSSSAPDMYYAVFEQENGLCAVCFEATAKTLHILHYYNHSTVMTNVSR
jgi:hypothetical protein